MSALDTHTASRGDSSPPAASRSQEDRKPPAAWVLQGLAATGCTILGEVLGASVTGKLLAGLLGAWLGGFLTAPGRHHRRRIVAVSILLALLLLLRDAARALAAPVRRRPRPDSGSKATASSILPASWTAVFAAAAVGFTVGTGATAAGHAVAGDGFRLTDHHAGPPAAPAAPHQPKPSETDTSGEHGGKKARGSPATGGTTTQTVKIPPVGGLTKAAAAKLLTSVGLQPTPTSEASGRIPAGLAIGTDPAAGETAKRGSDVKLLISSGVAEVVVPKVVDLEVDTARGVLDDAGLKASLGSEPACTTFCLVTSQKPDAGSKAPRGSTVTMSYVSR